MPKLTITGQPGPHGTTEQWQNAHAEDRNLNAKIRHQIQQERQREREFRASPEGQRIRRTQELGTAGERAIGRGDLKELSAIKRELAHLDKRFDEFARSNRLTPEERLAKRKEAREIMRGTHERLHEAAESAPGWRGAAARRIVGNSPRAARPQTGREAAGSPLLGGGRMTGHLLRGAGRAVGGRGGGILSDLGDVAEGVLAEGALDLLGPIGVVGGAGLAAGAISYGGYKAQKILAHRFNSMREAAAPFWRLERPAGEWGLATGGNSRRFLRNFYSAHGIPGWEKQLGITPEKAEQMLQEFGIVPRNAAAAKDLVKFAGGLKFQSPFAGMAHGTGLEVAKTAAELGMNRTAFSKELGKTLTDAVTHGVDRANVMRSIKQILSANTAAGGVIGTGRQEAYTWSRMLSSGAPGARTGALQQGLNANINNMLANLGKNPVSSMPLFEALEANGGWRSAAAVQRFLGKSKYDELRQSAYGRRILEDIESSPSPYLALRWIGVALKGDKRRVFQLEHGRSAFSHSPSQAMRDLGLSASSGATLPQIAAYQSGQRNPHISQYPANASAQPSPMVLHDIQEAAKRAGIPASVLYGVIGAESGFRPGAVNGNHVGLGQMGPQALAQIGMSGADMRNPKVAALASARYYKWLYGQFSSVKNRKKREYDALVSYYWGIGHKRQIIAGDIPEKYRHGTATKLAYEQEYDSFLGHQQRHDLRMAQAGLPQRATAAHLALNPALSAAKAASGAITEFGKVSTVASDAISRLAGSAGHAETALDRFAHRLERAVGKDVKQAQHYLSML